MGRCGGDAVLMAAEIGMLAKGAVDATLAVYDGLKAAVGMGSAGGGFRLVSIAGGGQTVLAPAGAAVAEGTVEGILGGVVEGSLSGFGFHTINDFLDNLAKIDADRVFGGEGGLDSIHNLDDFLTNPDKLSGISGNELYDYLIKNGYDVQPLSKGSFKGIPFEEGGGFKVNWGGDRILQYHPENLSHHGGAYFKISSGKTGTIRIDLDGNIIE